MQRVRGRSGVSVAIAVGALTCVVMVAGAVVGVGSAQAGRWMQTSCVNPDGSLAGHEGWTGYKEGNPPVGSTTTTDCTPQSSMKALLAGPFAAPAGSAEVLRYSPPAGSTLVGGRALVGLSADGYGELAAATAIVYTPAYAYDDGNVVLKCIAVAFACQNGLSNYYGIIELPRDRGGSLYVAAGCMGWVANKKCTTGANRGAYAIAGVQWANLLLATSTPPSAADVRGSLLDDAAHGTATLALTAADSGPGVYRVIIAIDGQAVYDQTPNTNAGHCVPVATGDNGVLMFAYEQPCPKTQPVDAQIRTTTLRDGSHELTVTVINAARDEATVLRRQITTDNRTTVSSTLTSDRPPDPAPSTPPKAVYEAVLDAPTQALAGGVRSRWSRSALTLSGTLQHSPGVVAQGVLVTLFARQAGQAAAQPVARTTTDVAGHWILPVAPGPSRDLTITYGEQPDPASAQAIRIRQTVVPDVTLRIRRLGGGRLRFSGHLKIQPLGDRPQIIIQTLNPQKRWKALGSALTVSASGAYSVVYDGGISVIGGKYAFRTIAPATPLYARGVSPIRRTVVR